MPEIGKTKKDLKYRLSDEYSLFYLAWIDPVKPTILHGGIKDYWIKTDTSQAWNIWSGYAFENICLKHITEIKAALGIGGVMTNVVPDHKSLCQDLRPDFSAGHSAERAGIFEQAVKRERAAQRNKDGSKIDKEFCGRAVGYWRGTYRDVGAEIDLVIDRADNCINLCEIKFYNEEYIMTQKDVDDFERKKRVFQMQTNTKKSIFFTLITPFGAKQNSHYLQCVHNQLTMECFF